MKPQKTEPPIVRVRVSLPPSVNHCYRRVYMRGKSGARYLGDKLTPEAEAWLQECQLRAQVAARRAGWRVEPERKVVVWVRVYWPDRRRRDTHNLHKLVADGLEGPLYADDRYALLRDVDWTVDRDDPRLELVCHYLEDTCDGTSRT